MSKQPLTFATSHFIFKDLRCRGFWLNKWFLERPLSARLAVMDELVELVENGKLAAPLHEEWSWSRTPDETQLLKFAGSGTRSLGKRVLVP